MKAGSKPRQIISGIRRAATIRNPLPLHQQVMMTAALEVAVGLVTVCWGVSAAGLFGPPGYLAKMLTLYGLQTQWAYWLCGVGGVTALIATYDIVFEVPYDLKVRRRVLLVRATCCEFLVFVWLTVIAVLTYTEALWSVTALTCWAPFALSLAVVSLIVNLRAETAINPNHETPNLHYH